MKFYDDAVKWRWQWFYATDAARALPDVVAYIDGMKAADKAEADASNAADDAAMSEFDLQAASGTGNEKS